MLIYFKISFSKINTQINLALIDISFVFYILKDFDDFIKKSPQKNGDIKMLSKEVKELL